MAVLALSGCVRNTYITPVPLDEDGREQIVVDLAEDTTSVTTAVSPGPYRLIVINRVPQEDYVVRTILRNIPVPPLDLPAPPDPPVNPVNPLSSCIRVEAAKVVLDAATSEVGVRSAVRQLEEAGGKDAAEECISLARANIARTRSEAGSFTLEAGQELLVTVQRSVGPTWTRAFTTNARGEWRTTYGFTFIGRVLNSRTYFTEDSAGTFVIKEMHRNDPLDYVPSLFFNWMPSEDEIEPLSYGLTAGLGFDFSNVVVMLGGSATYNQNISASAGVAFHQQERLLGQYKNGQTIGSSLTEAQLHSQRFLPNPFIAVSIRSLTNPFVRR